MRILYLGDCRRHAGALVGVSLRLPGEAALEELVEEQQCAEDQQIHEGHAGARW